MKTITTSFAIIFSVLFLQCQTNTEIPSYTSPELDGALLSLMQSSKEKDLKRCNTFLGKTENEWSIFKEKNKTNTIVDTIELNLLSYIGESIENAYQKLASENFNQLESSSYLLIWDFVNLRRLKEVNNYPIDKLMQLHLSYNEVHFTVHDQMMQLRYWFEFQELVEDFVDSWSAYCCIPDEEIIFYFPNMDLAQHNFAKEKIELCIERFIDSLESGFRLDFESPCDDTGNAIMDLFTLYANTQNTDNVIK